MRFIVPMFAIVDAPTEEAAMQAVNEIHLAGAPKVLLYQDEEIHAKVVTDDPDQEFFTLRDHYPNLNR